MSYKEFLNKFLNLVRSSSSSIKNAKELSYGEPGILQTILNYEKEEKKSITSGMIGKIQKLTSGRVSTAIKKLEKKNYDYREVSIIDRRKVYVKLTDKGRKIAEKINEQLASDAKIIFKKLGDKDANEFLRLMSLLAG